MVHWSRLRGPSGQGVQRPVILPPLEAGSCRCSVKPASRCACHIMDREAQLSHRPQPVHYAPWHGRGSSSISRPGPQRYNRVHITLMPPLGLQALATELGEWSRWRLLFKLVQCVLGWRGGTKQGGVMCFLVEGGALCFLLELGLRLEWALAA